MMKKHSIVKDSIIVGLALLSTRFGAGNLIFPPQIGLQSGTHWVAGALGLLLTGIALPVLALWAVNNVGDGPEALMGHFHPKFYDLFFLVSCILVAVGSTLPRSAATAHEIGVMGLFPNAPIWPTVIVFFVLVYFFASDRDSVIDKLGKYLTPLLVILLAIILIKGVVTPVGTPVDTGISNAFGSAMLTAYNTGDLTVGLMCAGIFLHDLGHRGYSGKERKKSGVLVGLVCIIALFAVYGTLTYIGATGSGSFAQDTAQTALLSGLIRQIMGTLGLACLGVAVALACLTTAVGIGSTMVSFFYEFLKHRVPYKVILLVVCVVSALLGATGVSSIISYVTPIFLVIYPICIVLTVLGLLDRFLPNDGFYKGGVLVAGIVSLGDAVLNVNPNIAWLQTVMTHLPLSGAGFSWLIPSVIAAIVGAVIYRGKPKFQLQPAAEVAAEKKQ